MKKSYKKLLAISFAASIISGESLACASGCGVFNVGTSSLMPSGQGGIAFLQYDYINQGQNWSKTKDSNGHNHDERINTQTVTAGMQYMFNRDWGAAIRVPYVTRYVKTMNHDDSISTTRHSDIGDVRINGIYSGFFDDMSTGITFGLKLPTGQTKAQSLNRNTQIGSGSTDTILGFYHRGNFGAESKMGYFLQSSWERPFIRSNGYTPGYEVSSAIGTYYNVGEVAFAKKVTPIVQFTNTKKGQDTGWADPSHNPNSGYNFVYFAPGVEITINDFKLYADVEFPVYRNVNGNQLVPQNLYKVILGYNF